MRYVVTPKQMFYAEEAAFEKSITPLKAMENAAKAVFEQVKEYKNVLVVCFHGNNSGDGFAVASMLKNSGTRVSVLMLGDESKLSDHSRFYYEKIKENIITFPENSYDCVIDAMFGIGFRSSLSGETLRGAQIINSLSGYKVSIDAPSGLNCLTGQAEYAVKADETVTFEAKKLGHVIGSGAEYTGKITVKNIGIDLSVCEEKGEKLIKEIEQADVAELIPQIKNTDHKGVRGHVGIIGGSFGLEGAVKLASKAAIKNPVGKVSICVPKDCAESFSDRDMNVMLTTQDKIEEFISHKDVILFGCGAGRSENTRKILELLLESCTCPLVLDADGLYFLEKESLKNAKCPVIITPHLKEAGRLFGVLAEELISAPIEHTEKFASETGATVLLKSNYNLICSGKEKYLCLFGCKGMAKAGSGDVLAGITASTVLGTKNALFGALAGAFIHGQAGRFAQEEKTEYSMTASDQCENIFKAYKALKK
ncbi:MAG: NAD(P)H-hydrate dehydratase [Clostridia bacterium]|nr:NAD(P)H-hydrate dehydratase [Clostridia bacterium]